MVEENRKSKKGSGVYSSSMKRESGQGSHLSQNLLESYPRKLIEALLGVEKESDNSFYLVGGTVRDWLMGEVPKDLDFAVKCGAIASCHMLTVHLGGGVVVPLGRQEDEAGRVVWRGLTVDIASFRSNAESIEEDLKMRDFTINAMAVSLADLTDKGRGPKLIDPLGGKDDLENNILRGCEHGFVDDPLRMLRGYRLSASFGFVIDLHTQLELKRHREKIENVSAERISYELNCIMDSNAAYGAMKNMAESGLLWHIIPELQKGVGLDQPGSHHLDVFYHSLETLKCMERILVNPESFFPGCSAQLLQYLEREDVRRCLKWAALFHDLGKPAVYNIAHDKGGRITFYNHDLVGKRLFMEVARRLRWSTHDSSMVASLIEMHMHPFHLCNVQRREEVSRRACLKLCKKAGENLKGLFLLAMADSLASRGDKAPEAMEKELVDLFCTLQEIIDHIIEPVLTGPRLLAGNDLIEIFHLEPGPAFSAILNELEIARVEGMVHDRQDAIDWVSNFLKKDGSDQ